MNSRLMLLPWCSVCENENDDTTKNLKVVPKHARTRVIKLKLIFYRNSVSWLSDVCCGIQKRGISSNLLPSEVLYQVRLTNTIVNLLETPHIR